MKISKNKIVLAVVLGAISLNFVGCGEKEARTVAYFNENGKEAIKMRKWCLKAEKMTPLQEKECDNVAHSSSKEYIIYTHDVECKLMSEGDSDVEKFCKTAIEQARPDLF
ncbi:MAG: hypothetical protein K5978_02340 [Campylobacter sp.]|nr:hypothetical protein [Campylobacter sp.]